MKNPITTTNSFRAVAMPLSMVLLAVCVGRFPVAAEPQAGMAPEQQKRLELMKSKGPDASLTILPVRLAGKPWDRVTEVVGVLLEQQGLRNIELGKTPFTPAETNLESLAAAVGAFVKTNPITTGYALYAEYNGDHQTGLNELRAVVVDQTGAVVWTDRLTMQDEAFKKMEDRDPMTLSVLLVERLGPQLGLNEETAKAAKPGKLAAIMDQRSGLPPENERAALPERQQAMKRALPGATLLVYPARIGGNKTSVPSATNVVRLLNQAGLCKAVQAEQTDSPQSFAGRSERAEGAVESGARVPGFCPHQSARGRLRALRRLRFQSAKRGAGLRAFRGVRPQGRMGDCGHAKLASSRLPEHRDHFPRPLRPTARQASGPDT